MTEQVTFVTPGGNQVIVEILTEEPSIVDHQRMTPCYELRVKLNGEAMIWGGTNLVHDPVHGPLLKGFIGRDAIKVPAHSVAAVDALLTAYKAEVRRRIDAEVQGDKAYQSHLHDMASVRGGALDPNADGKR